MFMPNYQLKRPILKQHPIREEIVAKIKYLTSSWKPFEVNENHFGELPLEMIQNKFGYIQQYQEQEIIATNSFMASIIDGAHIFANKLFGKKLKMSLQNKQNLGEQLTEIPLEFDARDKWPECIQGIRDQQLCGSCWAFASSGFIGDRFCIASQGQIKQVLSPQNMISCNYENFGCQGGMLIESLDYLIYEGLVSETCQPYQNQDSFCKLKCDNDKNDGTKYFCKKNSLTILSHPDDIKAELMANGPMMVGLSVYEDFLNYKEGIYEYTTGEQVGGHAIKLLGWGHDENGELYWKLQNQWGESWGEQGYVNIKHGQLGMDTMVVSCIPDLEEIK